MILALKNGRKIINSELTKKTKKLDFKLSAVFYQDYFLEISKRKIKNAKDEIFFF